MAKILVVDDSPANLAAYQALLGRLGQLFTARSGADAVHLAEENDFAAVLMDVMMPGLDGFDTTARIREHSRSRGVPVIFVTAAGEDRAQTVRAYQMGAVDMVYKPVDPDVLVGKVSALVNVHHRAESMREAEAAVAREQALRHAAEDANRQKDEFLLTLSHELRTPLTAIIGWTEMLRSKKMSAEQLQQAATTILRAARTQERLVGDLLEIGRIRAGKFTLTRELMDLGEVVTSTALAVMPSAKSRNIEVRVSVADRVLVHGDAIRLGQVVWNLLSNALKYARPSGGIVEVGLQSDGAHAELVIADDGIGIAPEFLPHVFERFRQADGGKTRAYSGLGIGLAIVHHVAAAHGGTVTAASEGLDRGSRFTLRLPVAQPADGETPRTTSRNAVISTGESPFSGLRVLLVEDDADLRELLSLVLSDEGSKVTAVGSAREGLEAFGSSKFDLLISDIGLPGEDGLSFMRRVRTFSVVPAVALTGFAGKDEEAEAIAAGFNGYLAKPLHIDQLRSILVELKTRASA